VYVTNVKNYGLMNNVNGVVENVEIS